MTRPLPGDFGVTKIPGRAGWWIGLGEYILDGNDQFDHAFVVIGNDQIVEARPDGATVAHLSRWPDAVFSTENPALDPTDTQRAAIVAAAVAMTAANGGQGIPYNWLDYGSLALAHFKIRPTFVRDRLNDGSYLICSQLVDRARLLGGYHLYDDGRLSGDVTPGDLGKLVRA